ncbi:MAG: BamA/TamA family outer membrane protein [Chlorobi bacterium]|nr:BamA/TamA family outer membrane protein [Chlorobiota bacterium]
MFIFLIFFASQFFSQGRYETGDIEFEFKKTETFDEAELLDILILPKEKYFNAANLGEDKQRINKYYFDHGFFDAIIDTVTNINREDKVINVKFIVIENSRYSIKEFKIEGLEKVPDNVKSGIYSESLIKAGDFYNKTLISSEKDRIGNILQNSGYLYAQIDTGRSRADSSRVGIIIGKYSELLQASPEFKNKVLVRMSFIGTEKVYYFGSIKINIPKDKYKLEKSVIERELKFKEGELFSRVKMLESERNFSKMPIIQLGRVEVDTVIESQSRTNIAVNITLTDKYELTPSISATYRDNRLFAGAGVEYKDKNFFGGGRVFTIGLEGLVHSININNFELSFSLYQPFFIRSSLTATFTSTIGLYNRNENQEFLYSQNLARFNYFIALHTFYNNAYSDLTFDYLRERAKKDYIDEDSALVTKGKKDYSVNSIVGLTLIHNDANDIFNPSSGFFHSITAESAGALPRFLALFNKSLLFSQYVKLYSNNNFYFDITGGRATTIIGKHFEIGDIIEYGRGSNIVPVSSFYKFFAGGGNSLRGWSAQTAGILANPSLGGNFLMEGSVELRRKPFPQRSFLFPVWFVLFLDYGNVWESDGKFRLNQVALATGLGIRYDTFVGPIRIDLGFRLFDPLAAEGNKWLWDKPRNIFRNKYAIQFGLGNAF